MLTGELKIYYKYNTLLILMCINEFVQFSHPIN